MPNAAVPSVDQIIVRPGDRKKVTVSALTVTKWNVNVKRGDDPLRSICRWHHP